MECEKKIIFACRWNKKEESSWSGSAYAVYKELEKLYEIERFDIKDSLGVLIFKLLRKLRLVRGEPSLVSVLQTSNKRFLKKYADGAYTIFQFCETPWTANTRNYIYQDLAVEYLLYLKKNDPVAYAHCGFTEITEKQLERRAALQKDFYNHCDYIFTMGQWLADFLRSEYAIPANKIKAVGAGINVPISEADYSQKKGNKIIFVGRDFERKGGKLLVEAFQRLKENYFESAELYIVGPARNPIKKHMDGIMYVGDISAEELQHYYRMCDIFCMPSYFEPYGIAFCEALVNGLPCIARNKFAMKEIIVDGETGYLLDDDNIDAFALKIYKLLTNEEIRRNVRENRERYIEKYSWKNIVANMQEQIQL